MKAILLSAGYGKRLGNITKNTPKCLLTINKTPILKIWIDRLYKIGVREILVNTHYLHHQVKDFLLSIKYENLKIHIKYEKKLLGTAGTLYKNIKFIDQDCFLIHSDNFNESKLGFFIRAHLSRPRKCVMSMMTHKVNNFKNFGMITKNKENILIGFDEKPLISKSKLANSAIYLISTDFVNATKKLFNKKDFSKEILPNMLGRVYCFTTTKNNIDIGLKNNYFKIKNH